MVDYIDISSQSKFSRRAQPMASVSGLVIHHTGGHGLASGVVRTLNQRGLSVQYVIDREGKIYRTFPEGAAARHIKSPDHPARADDLSGLDNDNALGVEIIAANDADVLPAQVEAAKMLASDLSMRYGLAPESIFGHGEIQTDKQGTEGGKVVGEMRRAASVMAGLRSPGGPSQAAPPTAALGFAPTLPEYASFGGEPPASMAQSAPAGEATLASLWGHEPLPAPQGAQRAITDLIAQPQPQLPSLPPSWVTDGAFPSPPRVSGRPDIPADLGLPPMPQGQGAPPPGMVPNPSMRPGALSPVRPPMPSAMADGSGLLPPLPQARPDMSSLPVQPPPPAAGGSVTVQPGDNPWTIAARVLGPEATNPQIAAKAQEIVQTNGVNPKRLMPGQVLQVAGAPPPAEAAGIPNPPMRPEGGPAPYPAASMANMPPIPEGGPPLSPEERARIRAELATLDQRNLPPINAVRPEYPGSLTDPYVSPVMGRPDAPPVSAAPYASPVAGRPDVPMPPYGSPVAGRPDVPLPARRRDLGLSYEPQPVVDAMPPPPPAPSQLEVEIAEGQRALEEAMRQQAETNRRQAVPPPTSGPEDQYLGLPAGTYPRPPAQESYTPMTGVMPQVRQPAGFGPQGLPQTSQIRGLPSLNTAAFPQGMEPNFLTDLGIFDEAAVPGQSPDQLSFDAMPSGPPYTPPPASGPSAGLSSPQVPPAPPSLSWIERNFYTGDPANLSAAPPAPPPPDTSPYGGLRSMADMWGVTMGSEAPQPTVSLSPGLSAPSWAERQAADAGASTTGQNGINSVFGVPQAEAAPPNLAIPYAEVPGYSAAYDPRTATPGRPNQFTQAPPPPSSWMTQNTHGPVPLEGTNLGYDLYVPNSFPGSVVATSSPPLGTTVVDPSTYGQAGTKPATTGLAEAVAAPSEAATTGAQKLPTPAKEPRQPQTVAAEQRNGPFAALVRLLAPRALGGPGGGILGGNGGLLGGMFAQPTYNWNGASGTSPMGIDYRTGIQTGLNRSGNSLLYPGTAMQWNTSDGSRSVTVSQDPWTGTYYQPTSGAPI